MELWKDVDGFSGVYAVSNFGRVKSHARTRHATDRWGNWQTYVMTEKIVQPEVTRTGYLRVYLRADKKRQRSGVHQLVAGAFLPQKPTEKHQLNHKNGVKTDNLPENLEWVTAQENCLHRSRVLKLGCGERNHRAKLTSDDVRAIREKYANGYRQAALAQEYGVRTNNICFIVNRKTWVTVV